jgi:alpha-tubulin suppressor-like RCC1 family protein
MARGQGEALTRAGIAVSTDGSSTCGIAAGKLYCWGSNYYGKVGSGTSETYAQYANALDKDAAGNDLPAFVDVDVGVINICARTADEKTYCWGYNASGDIRVGIPGATSSIGKPRLISLPN